MDEPITKKMVEDAMPITKKDLDDFRRELLAAIDAVAFVLDPDT